MELDSKNTLENSPLDDWATRGEYWLKKLNPTPQYQAQKRRVIHKPLVLSGHGIKLNIHRGTLLIKCGFTHYPQKREEYRFFPNDRQLPSRIVILDGDGSISLEALDWLALQNVPLVQIDWQGQVSFVGGASYSANPKMVQKQYVLLENSKRFKVASDLISQKIKHSMDVIKTFSNFEKDSSEFLQKIEKHHKILKHTILEDTQELLAIEGIAAATYFRYWFGLPIKWKGIAQKPIPIEWKTIGTRIGKNNSNQFSQHPVNTLFNYAYGVLENQVRTQITSIGADPKIGYIHNVKKNRDSFVYDLMEPVRPLMDKKVFEFIFNHTFSPDDFILNQHGICRLHPQFARYFVKQVQDISEIKTVTVLNIQKFL